MSPEVWVSVAPGAIVIGLLFVATPVPLLILFAPDSTKTGTDAFTMPKYEGFNTVSVLPGP